MAEFVVPLRKKIKNSLSLTSILLKTRCYLRTASWNENRPSKRHTGYTPFALGCTPHWSKILFYFNQQQYCDDTRPEEKLARATEQHIGL